MPLPLPNLDDRSYDQLLKEALDEISKNLHTDWTDLSPGDPGMVLLEAFTYLTDQMHYRLNLLPEKAYIAFLRLLGITLQPPKAAEVDLLFSYQGELSGPLVLPKGTRVTASKHSQAGQAVIFTTAEKVSLGTGKDPYAWGRAFQVELVEESLGTINGVAGQSFTVRRPPVAALPRLDPRFPNPLDVVVGVEALPGEDLTNARRVGDRFFHLWHEVERFSDQPAYQNVFTVDRQAGVIQFPPLVRLAQAKAGLRPRLRPSKRLRSQYSRSPQHLLVKAPRISLERVSSPLGSGRTEHGGREERTSREVRVWYPHGGGEPGNVREGVLDQILLPPGAVSTGSPSQRGLSLSKPEPSPYQAQGVSTSSTSLTVTNPRPAQGGLDGESLENALLRGPAQFFSQGRAVTREDYERLVTTSNEGRGLISRARAFTSADLWVHAPPGQIDLVLAPTLEKDQPPSLERLKTRIMAVGDKLVELKAMVAAHSTLGARPRLRWARMKPIHVHARVLNEGGANEEELSRRIIKNLTQRISPVESRPGAQDAWPFGQRISVNTIYRFLADSEPNVRVLNVELTSRYAPVQDITSLACDYFQPATWYAGSGQRLFRSTNDADGWELLLDFSPEGAENPFTSPLEIRQVSAGTPGWRPIPAPPPGHCELVQVVRPSPYCPGLVAMATSMPGPAQPGGPVGERRSGLYASADCGESWTVLVSDFVDQEIFDMAWLSGGAPPQTGVQTLLLGTSRGLLSVMVDFSPEGRPVLRGEPHSIKVDLERPKAGVAALVVLNSPAAPPRVAVALQGRGGVWISSPPQKLLQKVDQALTANDLPAARQALDSLVQTSSAGFTNSPTFFSSLGLKGYDIRHLNVQVYRDGIFLFAGLMAIGDLAFGVRRWSFSKNLEELEDVAEPFNQHGWQGGSCLCLAFQDDQILAGTAYGGILLGQYNNENPDRLTWQALDPQVELPRVHRTREDANRSADKDTPQERDYLPVVSLATNASSYGVRQGSIFLAGCRKDLVTPLESGDPNRQAPGGIYRSKDQGKQFEKVSRRSFQHLRDEITLPPDWLLLSDKHRVDIEEL